MKAKIYILYSIVFNYWINFINLLIDKYFEGLILDVIVISFET